MMLRNMRVCSPASSRSSAPRAVARPSAHHARQNIASPFAQQFLGGLVAPVPSRRAQLFLGRAVATQESPAVVAPKIVFEKGFDDQGLDVKVLKVGSEYKVTIKARNACRRVLHWGANEWNRPDESYWPAGTVPQDAKAVQSPFVDGTTVNMTIPEAVCPNTIVFVLKELDPENWVNCGGQHFTVVIRQPSAASIADKVVNAEATYTNWSLFNRLCLVLEVLDASKLAGPEGMALIFTWLRLSSTRVLPWYKNSNYQSKDIAHVQKTVAQNMADVARSAEDPISRMYARMALAGLPRGGGNGDDIRMGILNIMRANGIKEGHRPGIDERFLEQWHQKLHTNTSPDDITICEAYLAFLHSGNHDDYLRVLWERGTLTEEKLANFGQRITNRPMHLPHLIGPFQHFLWILKVTHSGADLDTAFTMAQGNLDEELRWIISDILANRNEWWVPGKIVTARSRLANYWKTPGASRDILLLDIALDDWFRVLLERTPAASLARDDALACVVMVLQNTLISVDSEDLQQVLSLWNNLLSKEGRWSKDWSLMALAAVQRTELSLANLMDGIYQQVQPIAERFGEACKIDPKSIVNFGEEVVRGQPAFVLSNLTKALEPVVREAAGVSSWQIVSQAPATGAVRVIADLADIQGQEFPSPTILIADKVGGMEDIPANVQAVLTRSLTDVLSHVAIRARSQGTLLASCFDAAEWAQLQALDGKHVCVSVSAEGAVTAAEAAVPAVSAGSSSAAASYPRLVLDPVDAQMSGPWALSEKDFTSCRVGKKSLNLAQLRSKLPDWLSAPTCVTLPFGTFERTLAANPGPAAELAALLGPLESSSGGGAGAFDALAKARALVSTGLTAPPELVTDVANIAAAAGLIPSPATWAPNTAAWGQAWSAICQVWASKWTERAWLSRRARQVPDNELFMAVLLQQVVPAQYAFVLHTANPITHDTNETVGELVLGMGETLVGNHPGRALSFNAPSPGSPGAGGQPLNVTGFPSKRTALYAPPAGTLIARSDANGEDLEEFAGAGLYDSITFTPLLETPANYAAEPLLNDTAFRASLLDQLVELGGVAVKAFGGAAQDVEGVYSNDGKLFVVQARPQVIPGAAK